MWLMSHDLVRCRPALDNWGLVGFFAVLGGLGFGSPWLVKPSPGMQPASPHSPLWVEGLSIASLIWLPALGVAAWMLLTETQADAWGLRWRRLWRWKTVVWSEVSDYYDEIPPQRRQRAVIETKAGRLTLDKHWYKGQDFQNLRHLVEQRATWARAKSWGLRGTRSEDEWPQVFAYDAVKTQRSIRASQLLVAGLVIGLLSLVAFRARHLWNVYGHDPGWVWDGAGMALFGLVIMMQPFLCVVLMQAKFRQARQHEGERIIATLDGLCFEAGQRRIQARWAEVTDYFITSTKHGGLEMAGDLAVVTAQGRFEFSQSLQDGARLRQIIKRYATQASTQDWRRDTSDALGAVSSQWSSGQPGIGAKIYHYRNRTSRAVLWIPVTYSFIATGMMPLSYYGLGNQNDIGLTPHIILSISLWLGTGWGWWRYYRAAVEVDETGITQHTLFKTKHITWADVQDYKYQKADLLSGVTVRGSQTRLWISVFISDFEDLQEQIKRRALHSRNGAWG